MKLSNKAIWLRCAAAVAVLASLHPLWFMDGGIYILESVKQIVYALGLASCAAVLSQFTWPQLSRGSLVKIFLAAGAVVAVPLLILNWIIALKAG